MQRMKMVWLIGVLIAVGAGLAFGAWGGGSPTHDQGERSMTCGDLTGQVGAPWDDFTQSGEGTASMSTTGDVGVRWNTGTEPTNGSLQPVPCKRSPGTTHYYYSQSSPPDPVPVSVSLTTSGTSGGTAQAHRYFTWAWNWHGVVAQADPRYQVWDPDSGWSDSFLFEEADKTADTNGNVDGGHTGASGTCSANVQPGSFAAAFEWSPGSAQRICFDLWIETVDDSASASNTAVLTENFLKMTFEFNTSVTD